MQVTFCAKFSALHQNYYTCNLSALKFTERNQKIEVIKTKHAEGKQNGDVKAVRILDSSVVYLPVNIMEQFNNVVLLSIKRCGLEKISRQDLKSFVSLEELYLSENKIEALSHDLFMDLLLIKKFSFRANKIKYISQHTLKPLKNLQYVNLKGNINIDLVYNKETSTEKVTFEVLKETIRSCCKPPTPEVSTTSSYMTKLWDTGLLSDFKIEVGSESFKVHKCVLGANSPVFEVMFSHNNMQENLQNKMKIDDFSPEIIKEFLEFIYLRKVPFERVNVMDLYAVSAKYQVEELMSIIEVFVLDEISSENAFSVFMLGNLYNNKIMKFFAFKEIESYVKTDLPTNLIDHPALLSKIFESNKQMEEELETARK